MVKKFLDCSIATRRTPNAPVRKEHPRREGEPLPHGDVPKKPLEKKPKAVKAVPVIPEMPKWTLPVENKPRKGKLIGMGYGSGTSSVVREPELNLNSYNDILKMLLATNKK